jgi:hypothetical protein
LKREEKKKTSGGGVIYPNTGRATPMWRPRTGRMGSWGTRGTSGPGYTFVCANGPQQIFRGKDQQRFPGERPTAISGGKTNEFSGGKANNDFRGKDQQRFPVGPKLLNNGRPFNRRARRGQQVKINNNFRGKDQQRFPGERPTTISGGKTNNDFR